MAKASKAKFRRIHTRKLDRSVAKHGMKIAGIKKAVKSGYFADHWREYANAIE